MNQKKPKWYVKLSRMGGTGDVVWFSETVSMLRVEQEMDYSLFQSMFGISLESGVTYSLKVKATVKEEKR